MQPLQIAYAIFILALFLVYGSWVRKGVLNGRAVLLAGIPLGIIAVTASVLEMLPYYRAGQPFYLIVMNGVMMAVLTLFCVLFSYRGQRVTDIATFVMGDTKLIVRVCGPARIPEADALLVATNTSLRPIDGPASALAGAMGSKVARELKAVGSVGLGKVIVTSAGNLGVGRIFHVAVTEAAKQVDVVRLRKGIEAAAQQARKANAESVAVAVGPISGLKLADAVEAMVSGVLKQRKAFAEIVVVVMDPRAASVVSTVVERAVRAETGSAAPLTPELPRHPKN